MAREDPLKCCPVCGVPFRKHQRGCAQRTLSGIDGANAAAANDNDGHWYELRPYGQRLIDGCRILSQDSEP